MVNLLTFCLLNYLLNTNFTIIQLRCGLQRAVITLLFKKEWIIIFVIKPLGGVNRDRISVVIESLGHL